MRTPSVARKVAVVRNAPLALLAAALATSAFLIGPGAAFAFPSEVFFVPKSFALGIVAFASGLMLAGRALRAARSVPAGAPVPSGDAPRGVALHVALGLYFAIGLASWVLSSRRGWSLFDWIAHDGAAVLLLLTARTRQARIGTGRLAALVVWIACAVGVIALLEARGVPFAWSQIRRPVSLLGNRNLVGAYVAVTIPFALTFVFSRVTPLRLLATALLFTTLTMTRCRSAWLGLLVAGLVALTLELLARPRSRPRASRVVAGFAAAAFGVGLAVSVPWPGLRWIEPHPIASTVERLLAYDSGSGGVRVRQARLALAMARARGLGVGPGAWDDAESEFAPAVGGAPHEWQVTDTPSSEAVRALAELGFPGALAVAAIAVMLGAASVRLALRRRRGRSWQGALLAALAVAGVHSFLDAPLSRPPTLALFAILAGLASAQPNEAAFSRRAARAMAMVTAVLGLGCAIAPTALLVAALRTPARSSPWAKADAQRIYPRLYMAEYLTQRFGALGRCAEADAEANRLAAWVPHHLGSYRAAASCFDRTGNAGAAAKWRARLRAVAPDAP